MTAGEEPLRFEVLGLLRVVRAGQEVDLGAAKQRAVLAVLLLARGTPVSRGQIIEAVWGDNVPSSAVNLVQTYVAGLRRALEPTRARRAPAELLTSVGDGYLMRVEPGALDLDVVERQVLLANRLRAAGDLAGAAVELDDALALFRAEPPAISGPADATAWFDAERANLIAAAELASGSGWHVHAWQLPYTLSRYLWLRTERETSLRLTEAALQAAIALNDDDARFVMQFNLGVALLQFERFEEALQAQQGALEVARRKEDVHQQARALTTVAGTLLDLGRAEEAEEHYREAMEISRIAGSKWAEANAHHHLGLLYLSTQRFDDAMPWLRVALRMYHEVGEQCGEAACHTDISTALLETGDTDGALSSARTALAVACDAVSPYHQALAHDRLAAVFERLGAAGAAAHWQRALALFTELGAPEADGVRARLARTRAVTVG